MSLASGHEAHDVEGDDFERLTKHFPTYRTGLVRLSPGGWVLPEHYRKYADRLYNFEIRPTDVFLITYPKVGTTWTQEILWTMLFNPDLENPKQSLSLQKRSPFIDLDMLFPREIPPEMEESLKPIYDDFAKTCPGKDPKEGIYWQTPSALEDPRVLKAHLPLSLLPPSLLDVAKVVYVIRNPADVITSYCHHCRLFNEMKFTGTLDEFSDLFMSDDVVYSPYWLHVKEAWEKRRHPNMHILRYENMKSDITTELGKLSDFLGTGLTEKQLENVARHTTFDAMRNRETTLFEYDMSETSPLVDAEVLKKDGGFFRQGKTGDGKKKLSQEMQTQVKEWCKKRFDFGLSFE